MKVKTVRFAMLRTTAQFENDRAECEVELGPKDKVEDAYVLAITSCINALALNTMTETGRRFDDLVEIIADPKGREAFKRFVAAENKRLGRL